MDVFQPPGDAGFGVAAGDRIMRLDGRPGQGNIKMAATASVLPDIGDRGLSRSGTRDAWDLDGQFRARPGCGGALWAAYRLHRLDLRN